MIVAKVGGRLTECDEFAPRLRAFLEVAERPLVLIAGGGRAADLVRDWDRSLELSEADAHWLATRSMSLQAELLARRLGLPLVHRFADCQTQDICVLDLWSELISAPHALPVGWQVTSDSLAAWAARRMNVNSLFLFKSVGDASTTIEDACQRGWVDPYFAVAAEHLKVEWINAFHFSSPDPSGGTVLR